MKAVIIVFLLLLLVSSGLCVAKWESSKGGDWNECKNWKGNKCPSTGDDMIDVTSLKTGSKISNIRGTYTGNLRTSRGELSLSGPFRVNSWKQDKDVVVSSMEYASGVPHELIVDGSVVVKEQLNLHSVSLVSRRDLVVEGNLVLKGYGASISGDFVHIGKNAEVFVVFSREKTHRILIAPILRIEGGSLLLHRHVNATIVIPADLAFATRVIGNFRKVKGGSVVNESTSLKLVYLQKPEKTEERFYLNQMTRGRFNNERIDLESSIGWAHDLNRTAVLHDFRHERVRVTDIYQEDELRSYIRFKFYNEHYEVDPEATIKLFSGSPNCEGFRSKWGLPGNQWTQLGLDIRTAVRSSTRSRQLKKEGLLELKEKYIVFCPQYSYKRRGLRIREKMVLLPKYEQMADEVVKNFFGEEKYIAMHMRGEDFDGYHCRIREQRNQAKPNECRQTPQYVRDYVLKVMEMTNVSNVYLLSNAKPESQNVVKNAISVKQLNWNKYEKIESILVDMIVSAKAKYFVGNRFSTFTGGIIELREDLFKISKQSAFIYGRDIKVEQQ